MEWTVSDPASLRTLARTFQTAAKLVDHIQFTPQPPSLHLRLLTSTHTVYAVFRLHPPFFSALSLPPNARPHNVPTRTLLPLLRTPQSVASLRLRATATHLHLTVLTHSALSKRFLVPLLDHRVTSVRTPPTTGTLRTSPSLLTDVLANFHARLDEITFTAHQQALTVASFVDDATNPSNAFLRTAVTLDARQLDHYVPPSALSPPSLTVAARPLRAAIEFCDALDAVITLRFANPGAPLLLDVALPATTPTPPFDVLFVFASRVVPDAAPLPPDRPSTRAAQAPPRPLLPNSISQTPSVTPAATPAATPVATAAFPPTALPVYSPPVRPVSETPSQTPLPQSASPNPHASLPHAVPPPVYDPTPTPTARRPMQNPTYVDEDAADDDDDFVEATPPPSPYGL